jgi:hypothetical protein
VLLAKESGCAESFDRALNNIVNSNSVIKSPEVLARHCSNLLKKNCETENVEKINHALVLFKYVSEKDVFLKIYTNLLAKRLIHEPSVSTQYEEDIILKLKQECRVTMCCTLN